MRLHFVAELAPSVMLNEVKRALHNGKDREYIVRRSLAKLAVVARGY